MVSIKALKVLRFIPVINVFSFTLTIPKVIKNFSDVVKVVVAFLIGTALNAVIMLPSNLIPIEAVRTVMQFIALGVFGFVMVSAEIKILEKHTEELNKTNNGIFQ